MTSRKSLAYRLKARPSCRLLLRQLIAWDLPLARDNAGRSSAARVEMMAMTTSSSISVKAAVESEVLRDADIVFIAWFWWLPTWATNTSDGELLFLEISRFLLPSALLQARREAMLAFSSLMSSHLWRVAWS